MSIVASMKVHNAERWQGVHLNPARLPAFDATAKRLIASKARYVAVEARLRTLGFYVPWWFTAVVSEREYGGPPHWDKQLGQGDPLGAVSRHDPVGRGPFFGADAWERGCLDALIDCGPYAAKWTDWSPGGTLTLWEEYNGIGYAMRGVSSAYVWSGTDQYTSGKYIADHVYRVNAVDVQEGCAPILMRMMMFDPTIKFGVSSPAPVPVLPLPPTPPLVSEPRVLTSDADPGGNGEQPGAVLPPKPLWERALEEFVRHGS